MKNLLSYCRSGGTREDEESHIGTVCRTTRYHLVNGERILLNLYRTVGESGGLEGPG